MGYGLEREYLGRKSFHVVLGKMCEYAQDNDAALIEDIIAAWVGEVWVGEGHPRGSAWVKWDAAWFDGNYT